MLIPGTGPSGNRAGKCEAGIAVTVVNPDESVARYSWCRLLGGQLRIEDGPEGQTGDFEDLVLDCKVGAGAFMKTVEDARRLCAAIRAIGAAAGVKVTCVLTDMDAPIGRTIGNALEVRESIEILRGGGPADTRELTVALVSDHRMRSLNRKGSFTSSLWSYTTV